MSEEIKHYCEDFDETRLYEEEIKPLIAKLISLCDKNNIPAILSLCFKSEGIKQTNAHCYLNFKHRYIQRIDKADDILDKDISEQMIERIFSELVKKAESDLAGDTSSDTKH